MNNIKKILKELGVTQVQFSSRIGVSQGAINHYINSNRNPDIDTCWKIVNSLRELGANCNFDEVFPDNTAFDKTA